MTGSESGPEGQSLRHVGWANLPPPPVPVGRYRAVLEYLGAQRGHDDLCPTESERIRATIALIPSDIDRVVDVGCGDGRIVSWLPARVHAVGVDYSMNSLRQPKRGGICASSESLPFRDCSVDLALCCEVLEHLPDETVTAVNQRYGNRWADWAETTSVRTAGTRSSTGRPEI